MILIKRQNRRFVAYFVIYKSKSKSCSGLGFENGVKRRSFTFKKRKSWIHEGTGMAIDQKWPHFGTWQDVSLITMPQHYPLTSFGAITLHCSITWTEPEELTMKSGVSWNATRWRIDWLIECGNLKFLSAKLSTCNQVIKILVSLTRRNLMSNYSSQRVLLTAVLMVATSPRLFAWEMHFLCNYVRFSHVHAFNVHFFVVTSDWDGFPQKKKTIHNRETKNEVVLKQT